jgi:hypothetical protein
MNQPIVCAVMLVNGREAMTRRAIRSFREQTYEAKSLMIIDNGDVPLAPMGYRKDLMHICLPREGRTVGALRNYANGRRNEYDDWSKIIIHWDSDDWSHPNRIAEQVALLQSSGKQCVGYRDMLFWHDGARHNAAGEILEEFPPSLTGYRSTGLQPAAWLYSNPDTQYCLGTSLCYWRSVWEQRPFPDLPKPGKERGGVGEDVEWLQGVDSLGITSLAPFRYDEPEQPRMIASIHGDNTQFYDPAEYVARERGNSWKRAPEWDHYCRERMAL